MVKLMHLPFESVMRMIASGPEFNMFNNADENPRGDTSIPRVFLGSFDKVPNSSRSTVGPIFLDKFLHCMMMGNEVVEYACGRLHTPRRSIYY